MQPSEYFTGWQTMDLTMGQIHKITDKDGEMRFVVLFPKTWEKVGERRTINTMAGPMEQQRYNVLSWEERELFLAEPE